MDEEFCPTVGWRDEPEATMGVPRPQDASELHAWGLTFDMSGGAKGVQRPFGRPLDGGLASRFAPAMHIYARHYGVLNVAWQPMH